MTAVVVLQHQRVKECHFVMSVDLIHETVCSLFTCVYSLIHRSEERAASFRVTESVCPPEPPGYLPEPESVTVNMEAVSRSEPAEQVPTTRH